MCSQKGLLQNDATVPFYYAKVCILRVKNAVKTTLSSCCLPTGSKEAEGIPKGKTATVSDTVGPIRFPLWPSGESGDHTEGPRRLFGYFLAGQKVSYLKAASFAAKSRFRFRTPLGAAVERTREGQDPPLRVRKKKARRGNRDGGRPVAVSTVL